MIHTEFKPEEIYASHNFKPQPNMQNQHRYLPDWEEFSQLAQPGLIVPVWRELVLDTETPVTAFKKIARSGKGFLLESVEGGHKSSQYSFLGSQPFMIFSARGRQIRIERADGQVNEHAGSVLDELRQVLAAYRSAVPAHCPRFCGGAVGYFGYEMVQQLMEGPAFRNRSPYPDVYLMFFDSVYIFDHSRRTMLFLTNVRVQGNPQEAYIAAGQKIDRMIAEFRQSVAEKSVVETVAQSKGVDPSANFTPQAFMQAVTRAKAHIAAGEVLQVVLSQKFRLPCKVAPLDLYRSLRSVNPSPYLFYLDGPGFQIVGSSPEVHVRLENGQVLLRPIAGTRPRGRDAQEDVQLEKELRNDPKEQAEHLMLVDLARQDLERVCEPESITVPVLGQIERYSHVMHLVSEVRGRLRSGEDGLSLLGATFPAGTVSGAPRKRAMELIAEIEPEARGVYAGAAGYLSFQGNLDTGIIIRTMVVEPEQITFQAGAGIVADSVPEREYQETRNKAQAILKAIQQLEESKE